MFEGLKHTYRTQILSVQHWFFAVLYSGANDTYSNLYLQDSAWSNGLAVSSFISVSLFHCTYHTGPLIVAVGISCGALHCHSKHHP